MFASCSPYAEESIFGKEAHGNKRSCKCASYDEKLAVKRVVSGFYNRKDMTKLSAPLRAPKCIDIDKTRTIRVPHHVANEFNECQYKSGCVISNSMHYEAALLF